MTVVIVIISAALATTAAVVNAVAARYVSGPLRGVTLATSVLAGFYATAYVWLSAHLANQGEWSQVVVWVGVLTWPVVWIIPPLLTIKWAVTSSTLLEQRAHELTKDIGSTE